MGIIIRQSLKASLGSYIGVGIGIINQLFVSVKLLTTDQLAISRLLLENSLVFAAFAHLGTPFIADRFFGYYRDHHSRNRGFLGFLLLYPILGIGLFAALYFGFEHQIQSYFAKESAKLVPYHVLVVPLTIFWIYITVLEAYCRNNSRIAIPTFIREVYLKLANILVVLLFGLGWVSFDWMLYLMVACYGLAVVILLIYIYKLGKFSLRFDFNSLKEGLLRQMAYFGLFVVLGGVGVQVVYFIDRTMLSHNEGLTSTAIFIIATYIGSIIEIPRKAITQISTPLLANSLRTNDLRHVRELYHKSSLNQLLVGGLVFLLIWTNIDGIFSLLPKADIYRQGKLVVLLIALSKLFDMATGLNGEIINYSKYFRFATYLMILMALTAVGTNAYFIPLYGYNGAALATALTTLLFALGKVGLVWIFFRMLPFTLSGAKAFLILAGVYGVSLVLPEWNGNWFEILLGISVRSAVLTLLFTGLVLGMRVSEDVNYTVSAMWARARSLGR
ncbi:lipopolysaccharide biosynthesis protein [Larkinella soli]|uniref:lipopolysaccharide biosynthesis protein n=1 Tax=Larkinella soli TaxID=1770527 RepID=UPI001E3ECE81|nr:polysaccharide biosynthesis C-terminal domain-containing protein [Larkinella soli]